MRAAGASQGAGIYLIEPRAWDLTANGERLDMAQMIERLLASKAQVVSFPVRDIRLRPPSSEVERLRPDDSEAVRPLGWQPRVRLEEALLQTIEWLSGYGHHIWVGTYVL